MSEKSEFHLNKPPRELSQSQADIVLQSLQDYPYKSVALGSTRANLTGLWRYWHPYYQTKRAPCDAACPVGNQVVDYIQTMLAGHWTEAANLLRSENPLPAITGRICHRPCEGACNRRQYDKRIAIHDIEAVLAEMAYEPLPFPAPDRALSVAAVGSGPAELAFAHFMALLGHNVTLFDPAANLGGSLYYGRQARHLPDGVLRAEIERIVQDRIELFREPFALEALQTQYDVLFGTLEDPEHLGLQIPHDGRAAPREDAQPANTPQHGSIIEIPLRVSEAIGYGKWVALLVDADARGLDAEETLRHTQVGGNPRIVSAIAYLALLAGQPPRRSEEVVGYEKLNLDLLEPQRAISPHQVAQAQPFLTTHFVSAGDIEAALSETARCFSCGRCNECDNCWIYCPDGVVSRDGGQYHIDYDYCKGCLLCVAVCPRGVFSVIEEEKWSA
jgi:Pyruvate/2-oxoacid:ferredoxin oxidoreductase delta subunit